MAIIFPDNPQIGDSTYTGGAYWEWDGERWLKLRDYDIGFTGSVGYTGSIGDRGYVGSIGPTGAPRANQVFIGDGLRFRFFLEANVYNPKSIFVIVNGLVLVPINDYIVENGNELVIFDTPNDLADIEVRYFDEAGFIGSTGYLGSVGYRGSVGETGPRGPEGFIGSSGFRGSVGDPGGPQGYTGSAGATGATGAGYTGSEGNPGAPKVSQTFIADGSTNTFTLIRTVNNTKTVFVMVNGLVLIPDTDYTIDGNILTIVETPNELADIEVRYFDEAGYTGSFGATGYRGSTGYDGSNGLCQVFLGPVAPPAEDIIDGELWWDTENGILNIWYTDEQTWVGIQQGPRGFRGYAGSKGDLGYTGSIGHTGSTGFVGSRGDTGFVGSQGNLGFTGSLGIGFAGSRGDKGFAGSIGSLGYAGSVGVGFTGSVGAGFTGSVGFVGSAGSGGGGNGFSRIVLNGIADIVADQVEDSFTLSEGIGIKFESTGTQLTIGSFPLEKYIDMGSASGTVNLDVTLANVFRIAPTGAFTVNFSGVSSMVPNGTTTTYVVIVDQGITPYIPSAARYDGISQTLKWQGGSVPTGSASKINAISFTLLKNSSGTSITLAQMIEFG